MINRLVVSSMKCQKMVTNADHCFPKAKNIDKQRRGRVRNHYSSIIIITGKCLQADKKKKETVTHIRNDDSELWVECVVHLADGSFVTPEGVVVLTVFGV